MIRCEHICKSFDGKQVLKDISAEFLPGEINMIIGRSGSGKTVLIKCIAGLFNVDGGEIYYGDTLFTSLDFKQRKAIRRDVGMIFQGGALLDSLTVEDNVRFPLDMFTEQSMAEKRERVEFCLWRGNLDGAGKLYPAELSGGMTKRVAIARAIVMNPRYLFCDEPNSGLDPVTSNVIDRLIYDITKEYGITTIVNTHDMNSVMEIGEKIVFINNGCKEWEGSSANLFTADNEALNDFVFASSMAKTVKAASDNGHISGNWNNMR